MNKDQILGKIEQIVGKAKQGVGEAAGSDTLANAGVADQVKGVVTETWGNAKEAAQEIHESHEEGASETIAEKMDETRDSVSRTAADFRDKSKEKIDEFKERHTA